MNDSLRTLKRFDARIGISIMEGNDWWLTIRADSQEEAVMFLKKSTQRNYIVKEVDDSYHNALSNLLSEILDEPIGELLINKKAEIKEFYELGSGHDLKFNKDDVVGYEGNKGVISAGLRLFGKYLLNPNKGEIFQPSYGTWEIDSADLE
jgi:hypothetical protein